MSCTGAVHPGPFIGVVSIVEAPVHDLGHFRPNVGALASGSNAPVDQVASRAVIAQAVSLVTSSIASCSDQPTVGS